MADAKLFKRNWLITVGNLEVSSHITGLACEFGVKKTTKVEPNTAHLRIHNLSADTRKALTNPKGLSVRIEAGYDGRMSQIYLGDLRASSPGEVHGSTISTELTSGDGEKAMQTSRLAVPIGAKTDNATALKAIAKALGVGMGNVPTYAAALALKRPVVFPRATVLNGNVARALTDFCRSAGLEWSIQDGVIQVLDLGQPLESNPYVLSPSSGLINSPKLSSDGKVQAEVLMLPELRPGMRVVFDSKTVQGLYRLTQAEYSGETHGQAWGIKITCEKPKAKA